jgi:predicted MFS family arabinose efflux permease
MSNSENSRLPAATVLLFATTCGIVVANVYYAQPLVGLIGPALGLSVGRASLIVSAMQLGYAAGLLILVPLGDIVENRFLVTLTIAASVPALLAAGLAQSGLMFLAAAICIGLTSVAVQMLVPFAANLAPDASRGQVVGNVMSGLVLGILLSRPLASMISDFSSWRVVFLVSAGAMALVAGLLRVALPYRKPKLGQRYGALLFSMLKLPFTMPALRNRAAYQFAAFGGFTLFWTATPLVLVQHFHYSQRGIAVFALVGAAGVFMAPVAGWLADRNFGRPGTLVSVSCVALAFLLAALGYACHSVVIMALAGVMLDASVQATLVFGQRVIYRLAPEMRSRLNGVFMAMFFVGGAVGSALTSPILLQFGFAGICTLGVSMAVLALVWFFAVER